VEVEVKLRDGRTDRVRVDKAPGSPTRDLTWDELRTKFMDCARHSQRITHDAAGRAFEAIRNIENAEDFGSIVRLLR
jgi:2-methylcitrate dehydratase PrpD